MPTKDRPIINLYVCDDLNNDKKVANIQKVQTDPGQDARKVARSLLLLPLKFVKKRPKKLKNTNKVNPRSLLTPTDNLNVERNATKKIKIIYDHRLRKLNKKPETNSAKPMNYKNNSEMNVESEQHLRQLKMKFKDDSGINIEKPMPSSRSTMSDDYEIMQNELMKEPVLAELPNTKADINVENNRHPINPNETWKIKIIKDEKLETVINTNIPIISEPLKSKTEINVNRNEHNLQKNEIKKLAKYGFQKVPKIGRPITVVPIFSNMEIDGQDNVQNSKNKIEIIKDDRLHKVLNMKRPIVDLNSKIEMYENNIEKHLAINANKQIYIINDEETLRIAQEKKGFTLVDDLNSKMEEVKPQLASGISLTKPFKTKIEPNNLETDEIQIKTLNGEFIIEPPNLQLKHNKFITKKPGEIKLKASKGSILIEPLSSQLNKNNFDTLNSKVTKLQTPKSGSLVIKALGSKKENTTENYGTFIKSPKFRIEKVKPKSTNVEQNKAKNLFVSNKLNFDCKQTADLKIKIITPLREENKVRTPNGNFVVTSNSNILRRNVSKFDIAFDDFIET